MTRRLTEVAAYAKVSEATVSRVLNGKPGVAEATRQAVLTALDVLGYERPTQLRGQRARLVGLVLPELQNPIFPAFAEVVADALSRRGVTPVLCTRTAAGVTEATIRKWASRGKITRYGSPGRAEYDIEELIRLAAARPGGASPVGPGVEGMGEGDVEMDVS